MASTTLLPYQTATVILTAGQAIATYGVQPYNVQSFPTFANYPTPVATQVFNGSGLNTTSTYTNGATVTVQAGGSAVTYNVGTGPVLWDRPFYQATPVAVNATATVTAANILSGMITSTTAAAVTGTTDTGANIDAAATFAINDFFDFVVINTGATNAFTLAAGTNITIVGSATVALSTSGRFRVVKTAAATFTIYRIA